MKKSAIRTIKGGVLVDERLLALQQILQSKTFSGCETILQILRFIVEKSIADRVDEIKEYTIATEVLGRAKEFNSKDDNIVRVQVHRLRKKLDEYYKGEGARDPLQIFIPRGHYYPQYLRPQIDQQPSSAQSAQESSANGHAVDLEKAMPAAPAAPAARTPRASKILTWQGLALAMIGLNIALITYHFISSRWDVQPNPRLAKSL